MRAVRTVLGGGAAVLWLIGCGPAPSPTPERADSHLIGGDRGAVDVVGLDGGSTDRSGSEGGLPRIDLAPLDAGTWREDAGVAYESYLACLQGTITVGACFRDAQGRAAQAGPAQLAFARAVANVDADGAVPTSQAGLSYHFCRPDGALYDCLVVDYWWSGVTAQISLTRLHRTGDGQARRRGLNTLPDSPEIMQAYLQAPDCDLGPAGYASLNLFHEGDADRIRVLAASDSLLLSDPELATVENRCSP